MKFYCDACNTKYAISDDKVRGKILKVRCKNCDNVITVREARAPVASSSGGAPSPGTVASSPAGVPTTNWYYALNGQTQGPFTLDGLRSKYASGNIGDETYVWHEALAEWKPVATVDAFADALAKGQRRSPRRQTIGFSGQLEAVQSAAGPSKVREGAVPGATASPSGGRRQQRPDQSAQSSKTQQPASRAKPKSPAKPKRAQAPVPEGKGPQRGKDERESKKARTPSRTPAKGQAPTPESRPLKDARREKLERLRARLGGAIAESKEDKKKPEPEQQDSAAPTSRPKPEPSEPSRPQPATEDQRATPSRSAEPSEDQLPTMDESELPRPVGGGAVLTFAEGLEAVDAEAGPQKPHEDAVDFDLPPRAKPSQPSPSSTSDILDQVIGPVEEPQAEDDSPVDSGVIPFVDGAPKLDGHADDVTGGQKQVTSGSLLIDLQNIQREGRGKRLLLVAGLGVLVSMIVGAGIFAAVTRESEPIVEPESQQPVPRQKDELVINTYSDDEHAKLATMELEEEFLFSEDEAKAAEQAAAAEQQADREEKRTGSTKARTGSARPKAKAKQPSASAKTERESKQPSPEQATVSARTDSDPGEPKSLKEALLRQRRELEVNRPKDKLREQLENKTGLTKDEARRGFRRIKESVRVCRERHNRRAAAIKAGKIKLSVKVRPNGRVGSFTATPASVQNTEFERCMQSHKGRWRFAQFNGDPVVINTSIILQ